MAQEPRLLPPPPSRLHFLSERTTLLPQCSDASAALSPFLFEIRTDDFPLTPQRSRLKNRLNEYHLGGKEKNDAHVAEVKSKRARVHHVLSARSPGEDSAVMSCTLVSGMLTVGRAKKYFVVAEKKMLLL